MGIVRCSRAYVPATSVMLSLIVLAHRKASDTHNKSFMQQGDWAEQFPLAYPTSSLARV